MKSTNSEIMQAIGTKFAELSVLFLNLENAGESVDTPEVVAPKKSKATKAPAIKIETEDEEAADEEEAEEGELTEADLQEMQLADLKELADENEIPYTKSVKKQPLIKIILDAMEAGEEEGEEAEEAEEADAEEAEEEEVDTIIETEDGEVDLATMSFVKLKKLAKEYEIELTAKDKATAITEILESLNADEEEEGEEAEEEAEEGEEELDLDAMSLEELQELAEEYEIELPAKKKTQKAAAYTQSIRELLEEELSEAEEAEEEEEAADEEEEEETDIAEEYGLNGMSLEELAEYLEEFGLSTKGKKQALIARIVKGIEDGTIEVEEEEGE